MKHLKLTLLLLVTITVTETSCQKQTANRQSNNSGISRKVQFSLYTDTDFSTNTDSITFSLFIKKLPNQTLWDSVLPSMQIKDIPDLTHKIFIEKLVPNNDTSLLRVGFNYSIKNIGNSWYIDSFKTGNTLKIVNFNFH